MQGRGLVCEQDPGDIALFEAAQRIRKKENRAQY
jgi:hypothetical protein